MTETTADLLMQLPLFAGSEPASLASLDLRPTVRQLQRGQLIFDRQDSSAEVYCVLSGAVLVMMFTDDGRELTFSKIGAGRYLGELSALDGSGRSLSAYAQSKTKVVVLSPPDFNRAFEALPDMRRQVVNKLVGMVRRLTDRTHQTTSLDVESRVRRFLVRLALEQNVLKPNGQIQDAPSHSEVASWIGANREAISRAFSCLNKSGVIDSGRRKVVILDPDELMQGLNT